MLINYAYANNHIATAQGFLVRINDAVLFPLLTLLTAAAVLVFLYGCYEYVRNSSSQDGRSTGGQHILWGIIGMLIMLAAYSILGVAAGTFNLRGELDRVSTQSLSPGTSGGSVTIPSGATTGTTGGTGGSTGAYTGSYTGTGGSSTGSFSVSAGDLAPVRSAMVTNGFTPAFADTVVSALQFSTSEASLRTNLGRYVDSGTIDQSVADQVMANVTQ